MSLILKREDVEQIAAQAGVEVTDQLIQMLETAHKLGVDAGCRWSNSNWIEAIETFKFPAVSNG